MAILRNGLLGKKRIRAALACLLLAMVHGVTHAEGQFSLDTGLFLEETFPGGKPAPGTVWLSGETRRVATEMLGHEPDYLRLRYWGDARRSAWIVDEIGKTEPITIGVVVSDGHIEVIRVLAFRESRGWEVRHGFFTDQFKGLGLAGDGALGGRIDGISGATLSVRAMENVARLVLYLAGSLQ